MRSDPKPQVNTESVVTERLLSEAGKRFDLERVSTNEVLKQVIDEVNKVIDEVTDEYEPVSHEPSFVGFENDPDLANISDELGRIFSGGLLSSSYISRFVYRPDLVNVRLGTQELYIPTEQFESWVGEDPAVSAYKVRAENFSTWVRDGHVPLMSLPIIVYSFSGESIESLAYLADTPAEQKMRMYKVGTIAHEVGHHLLEYFISEEMRASLAAASDAGVDVTHYVEKYRQGTLRTPASVLDEQFCEAIRLRATNASYLDKMAPKLSGWIGSYFPEIKAIRR